MVRPFRADDKGKRVVTPDGDDLGAIENVRGGDAYVSPRSDLLKGCGSWLTGTWETCDAFVLDPRCVAAIRDDRIVVEDATARSVSDPIVGSK